MANDLTTIKSHLDKANTILVALPVNPSQDVVAAALALYLSLQAYGKNASALASTAPVVRDSHLVGLDKITAEVGGKNLVLTINAPDDAVEKVTSNTDGGHLNLIVIPKSGGRPLTQADIGFSYTGVAADLIIVIGATTLADLGTLATKEDELFATTTLINLSSHSGTFGTVNLTDSGSSNSELVAALLQELKLPLDIDIASNLMRGIEDATSDLSSPAMTADTFEALAVLYRAGARRLPKNSSPPVKVVSNVPLVDIETKDHKPEELAVERDWMKPKIMQTSSAKVQ